MRLGALESVPAHLEIPTLPSRASHAGHADEEITAIRRAAVFSLRPTLRPTSRGKIIGHDPKIKHVLDTIDRVARSSCTVLVTGESGTGKELVVAALHDASDRRGQPLVTINCGAIPVDLVESELFGHARGAFTGAQNARRGHVAAAEGGTLFLDEVGELPLLVQVKLLRLLQQREYTPLGESRAVKCNVRIVAATNRNLEEEVRAGRFREDLYYRLNVINIHLPALRDRRGDIRHLAAHFFTRAVESCMRTDLRGFSESALAAIEAHPWKGNVRALENAIERGVLLARGPFVEVEDVLGRAAAPAIFSTPSSPAFVAPVAVSASRAPAVDPRREPESAPKSTGIRERFEVPRALPAPSLSSMTNSTPALQPPAMAAVLPLEGAGPVRHGSNPNFPRVLPTSGMDLFSAVEQYQNNLIRQALARTGGNKNRAAQLLGLNRTTLVEMIRRRGL
jgi:DNA-binding NtrC family response regulator